MSHNGRSGFTEPIYRPANPASGEPRELYHETDFVAYWVQQEDSTTPLGDVTVDCPDVDDTASYSIDFTAAQIDNALGALADGAIVGRVLEGTGLRILDWFTVRHARPSRRVPGSPRD